MAQIVGVHGIAHQLLGPDIVQNEWWPAITSGLEIAGHDVPDELKLKCAFYGDYFRKTGVMDESGVPDYTADDVEDPLEIELLEQWWRAAAATDDGVQGPDAKVMGRTPDFVQRALDALSGSKFFAGAAEKFMIGDLKQVSIYFSDDRMRQKIRERVAAKIEPDSRIVIGHSLGSVVAYEALCAHPEWPITDFVTLGSPLGINNLIFHRLSPAPTNNKGQWPNVKRWTNIADRGDIVALVKSLAPKFDGTIKDVLVNNEVQAHSAVPYLTAKETGDAIAAGI